LFEIKADVFAVREMGEEGAVMIDALQKDILSTKKQHQTPLELKSRKEELP
jgi:hypothetical protein